MAVVDLQAARSFGHDLSKYEWTEDLEKYLMYYLMCSPKIWHSVGRHIDPNGLKLPGSVQVLKVIQDHAAKYGSPPSTLTAFNSHLDTLVRAESKLYEADRVAVLNLQELEDVDMEVDDVRHQAGAFVRQRRMSASLSAVRMALAKNQDAEVVAPLISRLQGQLEIGNDVSTGASDVITKSTDIRAMLTARASASRISIGIPELDTRLEGGPLRGTLTTFGANSGTGKSWLLQQVCFTSLCAGLRVVYFDIGELGAEATMSRLVGCCTAMPEAKVLAQDLEVFRRWDLFCQRMGPLALRYIPSGTSVAKLREYVEEAKDSPGFEGGFDVMITDYGSKLKVLGHHMSRAEMYTAVWEQLRDLVTENNAWGFTASQLKDTDGERPTWEDLDWSRGKGEISDYVINFWKTSEDAEERIFSVAKARRAPESEVTDPLMNQLASKCRLVKPASTLDFLFD